MRSYANPALHAFIATVRPSELVSLTTFAEAQRRITVFSLMMRIRGYRSLEDFERHYPVGTEEPMNGPNYGWYQIRFHVLAPEVFDEDGDSALTRMWRFGQSEDPRRLALDALPRAPNTHRLDGADAKTGGRPPARVGVESTARQAIAGWH